MFPHPDAPPSCGTKIGHKMAKVRKPRRGEITGDSSTRAETREVVIGPLTRNLNKSTSTCALTYFDSSTAGKMGKQGGPRSFLPVVAVTDKGWQPFWAPTDDKLEGVGSVCLT